MDQAQPNPTLCRNGCGFYGTSATDGMCSKCYKDTLRRKQNSPNSGRISPAGNSSSTSTNPVTHEESSPAGSWEDVADSSASPQAEVQAEPEGAVAPTTTNVADSTLQEDDQSSQSDRSQNSPDSQKGKSKKNRCFTCRKKVGLTGFSCRCGGLYCGLHRYSDKHDCTFDYKAAGQEQIRKNNPVVVGEKIQKL